MVLTYSTSSIMSGVFWNVPGCVPNSSSFFSSGRHRHATASSFTVARLMSASAE
jgi:hypothetical protein